MGYGREGADPRQKPGSDVGAGDEITGNVDWAVGAAALVQLLGEFGSGGDDGRAEVRRRCFASGLVVALT